MENNSSLLKTSDISSGYGNKEIIRNISIEIKPGEIVAIIGHNGAGKSTLLKTIFGLIPLWNGTISYDGNSIVNWSIFEKLRQGIVFVSQDNKVFTELTVMENLEMGIYCLGFNKINKCLLQKIYSIYPELQKLENHIAGTLSGGEQQMLSMASALILSPRLLLLDEPSLGLSPTLVEKTFSKIKNIARDTNCAVLIVEQKVNKVLNISDRAYLFKMGVIKAEDTANNFLKENKIQKLFL
jgi:ABC-type branched-subunit amino acid transport system ATPase component